MSEIEDGYEEVTEELPSSENDFQDDNSFSEEDNFDNQDQQETQQKPSREDELQKLLEEKERTIRLLQDSYVKSQTQEQRQPEPEYDPEDLPTYRDVKNLVGKETEALRQQYRSNYVSQRVEIARSKYSDYDQVIDLGKQIIGNNQQLADTIINTMEDPAEFVYNLGKTHSGYRPPVDNKGVGDKIRNNLNRPNTLNQTSGRQPQVNKDYSQLSDAEMEAEIRRAKLLSRR